MNAVGDEAEARHFDEIAAEYECRIGLMSRAASNKIGRLAQSFSTWLDAGPPGPLLEIGAGAGFLTRSLAPLVFPRRYVATDLSAGMIQMALCNATSPNVEWRTGDCLDLELATGSVACVVGHGILHHLPLEIAVAEVARVLRPGGRIAFYEPNLLNPVVFLQKKVPLFRPSTDTVGETGLLKRVIVPMLGRHGFVTICVTPCEFVMNQVPDKLVPLAERVSRLGERLPGIREFGGSLRILAAKA